MDPSLSLANLINPFHIPPLPNRVSNNSGSQVHSPTLPRFASQSRSSPRLYAHSLLHPPAQIQSHNSARKRHFESSRRTEPNISNDATQPSKRIKLSLSFSLDMDLDVQCGEENGHVEVHLSKPRAICVKIRPRSYSIHASEQGMSPELDAPFSFGPLAEPGLVRGSRSVPKISTHGRGQVEAIDYRVRSPPSGLPHDASSSVSSLQSPNTFSTPSVYSKASWESPSPLVARSIFLAPLPSSSRRRPSATPKRNQSSNAPRHQISASPPNPFTSSPTSSIVQAQLGSSSFSRRVAAATKLFRNLSNSPDSARSEEELFHEGGSKPDSDSAQRNEGDVGMEKEGLPTFTLFEPREDEDTESVVSSLEEDDSNTLNGSGTTRDVVSTPIFQE